MHDIETLQRQVRELRQALAPFACLASCPSVLDSVRGEVGLELRSFSGRCEYGIRTDDFIRAAYTYVATEPSRNPKKPPLP